jgi:GNAT superfamily N-acetyltransferase
MTVQQIGHRNPEHQRAFCEFVPKIFTRVSFARWRDWGLWADDYIACSWIENSVVLANASLTRMQLCVDGHWQRAWQLGAVGCLPAQRGRGLARACLDVALQICGSDPVLLFANPQVRAFYPRFGFVAREEALFGIDYQLQPASQRALALDLEQTASRELLLQLHRRALPISHVFTARDYGRIALWYAANGLARPLWQLGPETLICAGVEDETLYIDDIISSVRVDLRALLPQIIEQPVRRIQFGFTPDLWWPRIAAAGVDPDPHLFIRGFVQLPGKPHKFPLMAQT